MKTFDEFASQCPWRQAYYGGTLVLCESSASWKHRNACTEKTCALYYAYKLAKEQS